MNLLTVATAITVALSNPVYPGVPITTEEYELLARLVNAEACGENLDGKIAIVQVVFNRARIKNTSVKYQVFKKNAFCGTRTDRFVQMPSPECYRAVDLFLRGKRVVTDNTYYFYNPKHVNKSGWNLKLINQPYTRLGNHRFVERF